MIVDVHSHIQFKSFSDKEREEILFNMKQIGLVALVVGTNKKTSQDAIKLAKENPDTLRATVGVHPLEKEEELFDFDNLCKEEVVVAIGECGFDYTRTENPAETKKLQRKRFLRHCEVANQYNLPLMMHIRTNKEDIDTEKDAHRDFIEIFSQVKKENPNLHAHIHFFTEARVAEELIALDCTFSFSGVITFVKEYEEAVKKVPLERIMTETDCPYATPSPVRKQGHGIKNEPKNAIFMAEKIAEIKKMNKEEVVNTIKNNAIRVFKLP